MQYGRGLLKLTTASYWRPSGVNIHRMPGDPEDADWGVRPTGGCEVDLTDEEKAAWLVWRAERDLKVIYPADVGAAESLTKDPWADPMLQRAIEGLTAMLPEK